MLKTLPLHTRGIPASRIALGCMGLGGGWDHEPITAGNVRQGHEAVEAALSIGINFLIMQISTPAERRRRYSDSSSKTAPDCGKRLLSSPNAASS